MVKARTAFNIFYSKILHTTCGLRRGAKQVKSRFNTVDKLVASIKQVIKKASSQI